MGVRCNETGHDSDRRLSESSRQRTFLAQRESQRGMATPSPDWLQPPAQERGLAGYVQTLRERVWMIVAAVVITTGA
jgi:hypothetical protein